MQLNKINFKISYFGTCGQCGHEGFGLNYHATQNEIDTICKLDSHKFEFFYHNSIMKNINVHTLLKIIILFMAYFILLTIHEVVVTHI